MFGTVADLASFPMTTTLSTAMTLAAESTDDMRACIGRFCVELRTLAFFWVLSNIVTVLACVMVMELAKISIARQKKVFKLKKQTDKKATDGTQNSGANDDPTSPTNNEPGGLSEPGLIFYTTQSSGKRFHISKNCPSLKNTGKAQAWKRCGY